MHIYIYVYPSENRTQSQKGTTREGAGIDWKGVGKTIRESRRTPLPVGKAVSTAHGPVCSVVVGALGQPHAGGAFTKGMSSELPDGSVQL